MCRQNELVGGHGLDRLAASLATQLPGRPPRYHQLLWPAPSTLSPALAAGAKAWLSPPLPSWEAYLEAGGLEPDPLELYQWDLQGVLHLKGVLSERSVARALASIEANRRGETGDGRGDVISWANGFGAPFREMMAHPAVLARLAWMQGPGSCNNSRSLFCYERGDGGQGIHGDVTGTGPGSQYHNYEFLSQGGNRTRTGSINVAWQLMDVDETDGGFVSPSSHARAACLSCPSCSTDTRSLLLHGRCSCRADTKPR